MGHWERGYRAYGRTWRQTRACSRVSGAVDVTCKLIRSKRSLDRKEAFLSDVQDVFAVMAAQVGGGGMW